MAEKEKKKASKAKKRAYSRYVRDPVFVGLSVLCILLLMVTVYFASGAHCPSGATIVVDDDTEDDTPTPQECTRIEDVGDKLAVYEFSEFYCPFCSGAVGLNEGLEKNFRENMDPTWEAPVPKIEEVYADDAEIIFKHFVVHDVEEAKKSAEAAECARDQCKFREMHDIMFKNQANLKVSDLKKYAAEIGLDTDQFGECLDSGEKEAMVAEDTALAKDKLGFRGTPSFLITKEKDVTSMADLGKVIMTLEGGGVVVYEKGSTIGGAYSFSVFEKVIEMELDPSKKAQALADQEEAERRKAEEAMQKLGVVKDDNKPQIDFFVMSYCPFGNIAEEAVEPVYQNLGDKAIYNPRYVIYNQYRGGGPDYCIADGEYCSMHGVQELNQNIRELCVNKYMGIGKYFEFVLEMNKKCDYKNADTCWEAVAQDLGLDTAKIATCEAEEGVELAKNDYELCQALGVSGSPTVYVEGAKYAGGRTAQGFQSALCAAFDTPPEECQTALSNEEAGPTGSC